MKFEDLSRIQTGFLQNLKYASSTIETDILDCLADAKSTDEFKVMVHNQLGALKGEIDSVLDSVTDFF